MLFLDLFELNCVWVAWVGSPGELFQVLEQLRGSLGMCFKIRFVGLVTKEPLPGGAGIGQP